jgi:ribosomal protein S6
MLQQAELLEYDAHPAAHGRQLIAREAPGRPAKQRDFAERRLQRQVQEFEKAGFSRARRACQESERSLFQAEINTAKNVIRSVVT